jgi:hypothetical protein
MIPMNRKERGFSLLEALAALLVVGLGIVLFLKVQNMTGHARGTNVKKLAAGKLIEKYVEDTRIAIQRDTLANWPPRSRLLPPEPPHDIALEIVVGQARSPKDGSLVQNVRSLQITATWTRPVPDTLKVSTYVSRRF